MKTSTGSKGSIIALLPFLLFIFSFLGAGIYLNDFYALPSPIAVTLGIASAFILFKDAMPVKVSTFLKGCGDEKIMTMCVIYLLAGAFTVVSKATGSIDAVVDLGLTYFSVNFLYAGVFLLAAFLSFATGTSVGAIVALAAIVSGFAEKSGVSLPVLSASLLGGAMFGDNLSFISDTTIAATQTMGCEMKDKFRQNFKIALPAAILTVIILLFQGMFLQDTPIPEANSANPIKIIPYLLVITLAILGLNVFTVLFLGILSAGAVGFYYSSFNLLEFANLSYEGFTGMTEIFLLSMLTGGLAALVTKAGGLNYITSLITRKITKHSAYLKIGGLVGLTNLAIANNTVSIIITGSIAKEIKDRLDLNKIKVASVLDIFACVIQGMLPYGAQVLLLLSYARGKMNYFDLISNAWYLWLLGACTASYFIFNIKTGKNKVEDLLEEQPA
ncbi:Na+/H+ antiporter NhaC [Salinimicrobium catena]|uniref:Na+/H+ antiporter NhaC n=1 Tax=Salinimicrobium catena TaxID=390640 RepID=A0A1H5MSC1_9FLAO|nr:Na+/H+ antiporter NhaC family protein [Salinimicrobium catena]SDL28798.1 Na+/H+ antiporter NhaC [Salinimicrobium catena]SEE92259.1 Na+/H+ antiporter NhaC [Salinimicrobium catena]